MSHGHRRDGVEPFSVVVFDLDGTLARTAHLTPGRRCPADVLLVVRRSEDIQKLAFNAAVSDLPAVALGQGMGVAVITRSPLPYASTLLQLLDVDYHTLRASNFGSSVPQKLRAVAESFAVPISQMLYVGDTDDDRTAAAQAGCGFLTPPWLSNPTDVGTFLTSGTPLRFRHARLDAVTSPAGSLLNALQCAVHAAASLSDEAVHALASDRISEQDRAGLASSLLDAAPHERHRSQLQSWALRGLSRGELRCALTVDQAEGMFAVSANVIRRAEYRRAGASRDAFFVALRNLFPLRPVRSFLRPGEVPVEACSAFHSPFGGGVLRAAKDWVRDANGHSGPEVVLRLLETPAATIAAHIGAGPEAVVPTPSSPFSSAQPGEVSVRLAQRVATLTGREFRHVLTKDGAGDAACGTRGQGSAVILVEDQITGGATVTKSVAALDAAGFVVTRVIAWSTSGRNLAALPPTAGCVLGRAAAALTIPPCCPPDGDADELQSALSSVALSTHQRRSPMTAGGSLYDAARHVLGVSVVGGHPRFAGPTWNYEGGAGMCCFECGEELQVFRRPYESAGKQYRYWGFVCPGCRRCFTLDEFDTASQKLLRSHASK